jgi:DNA-binding IclR family transcriptional regulator
MLPAGPQPENDAMPSVPVNLIHRIREEFEELPGLRLTLSEAARFWGLDLATCEEILASLLASGFLTKGADHRYRSLQ